MNASTRRLIRHTHSTPHTLVCAQAEKRRKSARTLTSYQLFMQGEREALKHLPPKEVMTEIARRWKLLDAGTKALGLGKELQAGVLAYKRNERVAACAKRSDNAWGAPPDGFEWGATF